MAGFVGVGFSGFGDLDGILDRGFFGRGRRGGVEGDGEWLCMGMGWMGWRDGEDGDGEWLCCGLKA